MTYNQHQNTRFIENLDEANAKLNELEGKLGMPKSDFDANIDAVNRRIWELETGQGSSSSPSGGKRQAAPAGLVPGKKDTTAQDSIVNFYNTGKARGIHKAMGAAIVRERA